MEKYENRFIQIYKKDPNFLSDKALRGSVVNRTCCSINGELLENMTISLSISNLIK